MATSTAVSTPLEEYLTTSYRPDCDWVDGEVRERNVGEQPHANVQAFLAYVFRLHLDDWSVRGLPEQRVQTSDRHFRIPDICVIRRETPFEAIVRTAPLLCVEILSREDRMGEILERVEDYLGMGVKAVWVIDPWRRKAYTAIRMGSLDAVPDVLTVEGTAIRVPLAEVFAELDGMAPVL